MVVRIQIEPNSYFDSVALMAVASVVNRLPGVDLAALLMGTSANLELLRDSGLWDERLETVSPNDLVIAVRASDDAAAERAIDEAVHRLRSSARTSQVSEAKVTLRTLRTALRQVSQASVVAISVPGPYAPIEAEEALRADRHVFLFSDNVPIEEEVRLKELAQERGLLLMGPDCGTAFIAVSAS
jgi:FdrA protein